MALHWFFILKHATKLKFSRLSCLHVTAAQTSTFMFTVFLVSLNSQRTDTHTFLRDAFAEHNHSQHNGRLDLF